MQPLQWSSASAQTPSVAPSLCINAKWKGLCTPQSHRALHHWPLFADPHVATFIFPQPCSDHIFPFPDMHADSPLPTEKCPHASVGSSETSPACPAFINFFLYDSSPDPQIHQHLPLLSISLKVPLTWDSYSLSSLFLPPQNSTSSKTSSSVLS